MSSTLAILIAAAATAGMLVFFVKWRALRRECRLLAEAIREGSSSRLRRMGGASGSSNVAARLAEACLNSLGEKESLRRRAEDRELFQTLLNEIGHGFFIVNRDLEVQFANKAIKKLFPAMCEGEDRRLIEVLMDHRLVKVVRDAVEKGKRRSREVRMEGARGNGEGRLDRDFEIEAAPLPGDPEAGCWVMIRDITERVVTEQVRKDFVANASHELRTPLTLINGYVETLAEGLIDDREAAIKSLGIMRKHGRRIVRIIEDMLTISRLEGSETPLRLEPFDMAECVTDVVDHLATLIEDKKAIVEFEFPEGDRSIVGDRFYWDQVFMNLIENALKQNQRAGLRVMVRFTSEGDRYNISVADDGVGIARGDLPYVFKRFYRGAKHHSQEIPGTGLGLSIVKRAVEAHGGTVSVESRPGVETIFRIGAPVLELGEGGDPLSPPASGKESLIGAADAKG